MDMDMDMDMDTDNQHGPAAEPCLGPLVTVPAPLRTRMGAPHREERAHFTASILYELCAHELCCCCWRVVACRARRS